MFVGHDKIFQENILPLTPEFCVYQKGTNKLSIFLKKHFIALLFCFNACMCTMCMPNAQGSQKRAPNPLETELQMFVSHHVGASNRIWLLFFCLFGGLFLR